MKRRLLATFLSLCLLVGLLPTVALAEESPASETQGESSEQQATATDSTHVSTTDILSGNSTDGTMSGTCGATEQDNVRWTLNKNGETVTIDGEPKDAYTLTISGTGKMMDMDVLGVDDENTPQEEWTTDTRPWGANIYNITKVNVEEGVLNIGKRSLKCAKNLVEVSFPDSLEEIGYQAFHYCSQLKDLTIPSNVNEIMQSAFQGTGIKSIVIPGSVKIVGPYAFLGCSNLSSVEISDGVEQIGTQAFALTAITVIEIPDTINSLGTGAFYSCQQLVEVVLPSSLSEIPEQLFQFSGIKCLSLPDAVTKIGDNAFLGAKLDSIFIPESVNSIGEKAFTNLNDKSVIYLATQAQSQLMTTSNFSIAKTALAITNGGTFAEGTEFTSGTLATPIKDGAIFAGWYDNEQCSGTAVDTPTAGQTYYAKWEIETDTSWYVNGTADTYRISNVAQLAGLAKLVNDGYNFDGQTVELSADINLNNMDWKAIGTLDKPFKGEFDGNSHSISNFVISDSTATYQGLFGYCESAKIYNFSITDVDIVCDYRGGIVAGVASGSTFDNIKIYDSTIDGRGHIGGLIGRVQTISTGDSTVTVTNCDMENVSVSAMSVADSWNGTVNNNDSSNKVDSVTPFSTRCGGITSITVNAPLVISGCDLENVTVKSWGYSGGMVGVAHGASATVSIERSSFLGTVDSKSGGATAGLATGSNNAKITVDNCRVEATLDGNEVEEFQQNCEYPFISTGTVKNSTADVIFTRNATIFPSSDSTTLNGSAEDCTVNAKFAAGIAQQSFLGYTVYTQSTTFENCAVTVELTNNDTDVTLSAYRRGNHDSNKDKNTTYLGCTLLISADDMSSISVETGVGGASPLYVDFNLPVTITPSKTSNVTDANTIAVLNGGTFAEGTVFESGKLAPPSKDGAIFAGWYADSNFSGSPVTSTTAGQSYYARWIDLSTLSVDSIQYGGTAATPTLDGVTFSNWQSEDSSIVSIEDNQIKANKVGETTITATATYNGNTAEVSVPVEVTPRVLTYTLTGGNSGSGSITYNYSGGHHALSDSLTFQWDDEPGTVVTLREGTDINYTYTVNDPEAPDSGTALSYDYLPMPVGSYDNVKFNLLNENYTFGLSDGSTRDYLEIDVEVVAEGSQRAYLASAAPKADQNFVYTGQGVLPVEGTLNAYADNSASSDPVDIGTFTVNIEGLNDTSFHSKVSGIYAGTDLSAINGLALPTEPGTYIITASAASETHYLYKSLVFTISKATVTVKAVDETIYVGDTMPDFTYTVSGLASGDSLTAEPTLTCNATDTNTAGTYTITPSGAAVPNTEHYNSEIDYRSGTLTISTRSSGGGSSSGSSNVSGSGDDVSISASGGSVTASQMESAVKKADEGATITIKATGSSKISLPASGLESAADNDNSLTLDLRYGEVTLSPDALSAVADQAGSTVTLTVAPVDTDELNSRQQAAVGDAPVFDLTIRSGSTVISDFDGGLVTVSIPYELPSNQDPAGVVVWFMDDDGNITPCETMYDTRTETVIFTTRHFSKYVIGYEEPTVFTDVSEDAYYADAVLWAVANGVTYGTSATTFSPDMAVSRAQMVTFLWRAHGSPKATGANPFTDVSTSDYYYDAVLWAVANGVTNGTSATTFSPDMAVTRAQAVTFQWRAAGSPVVSGSSFSDVAADAYYVNAVTWAVANGITNGTSATTFSPDVVVSRAQAVTFLYREQE